MALSLCLSPALNSRLREGQLEYWGKGSPFAGCFDIRQSQVVISAMSVGCKERVGRAFSFNSLSFRMCLGLWEAGSSLHALTNTKLGLSHTLRVSHRNQNTAKNDVRCSRNVVAVSSPESSSGSWNRGNPPIPIFRNKFQIGDRQLAGLGRDTRNDLKTTVGTATHSKRWHDMYVTNILGLEA